MRKKSRITAALLAFMLGSFGVHKFYLNRPGQGVFYIVLLMTLRVTFILGIIDAVRYLMMSDEEFDARYNQGEREWENYRRRARDMRSPGRRATDPRARVTDRRRSRTQRSGEEPLRRSRRSGRFEREHSRRASASRPRRSPARRERVRDNPFKQSGIRRFKDYDIDGAIEDFQKALKMEPEDIAIHWNLACAYSLNEEKDRAYFHLSEAIKFGFNDTERIDSHEALAYLRIQDDWDAFKAAGYRTNKTVAAPSDTGLLDNDTLLDQLNKLKELREKGLLSELEYEQQKQRLQG